MRYLHTLDARDVDELVRSYNEEPCEEMTTYELRLLPAVVVVDRPKAIVTRVLERYNIRTQTQ